jgi:hypothetical protein
MKATIQQALRFRTLRPALVAAAVAVGLALSSGVAEAGGPYQFFSITPCRLADTRNPNGVYGGPPLVPNQVRSYPVTGNCGIPATAKAVVFNFTVVQPDADGNLVVYPFGGSVPITSVLNWSAGEFAIGNGAIIPLANSTDDISVFPNTTPTAGPINLVIDVTGYFQ